MIAKFTQTRQTRVLYIISILTGGALLLVLFLYSRPVIAPSVVSPQNGKTLVAIGSTNILVTIADTQAKQEQGLSGTKSLAPNEGELFAFGSPSKYGFWMKDMAYNLDIIWIDKDFKVVAISKDLAPSTYPEVFYPPVDIQYALEVDSGFSTAHDILPNQLLTLHPELVF